MIQVHRELLELAKFFRNPCFVFHSGQKKARAKTFSFYDRYESFENRVGSASWSLAPGDLPCAPQNLIKKLPYAQGEFPTHLSHLQRMDENEIGFQKKNQFALLPFTANHQYNNCPSPDAIFQLQNGYR